MPALSSAARRRGIYIDGVARERGGCEATSEPSASGPGDGDGDGSWWALGLGGSASCVLLPLRLWMLGLGS